MQRAFRIEKPFKYIPKVKVNNSTIYTPRFWLSAPGNAGKLFGKYGKVGKLLIVARG